MKKRKDSPMDLGRRERQIMSYIYQQGRATAAEVLEGIANPPSYSGVRAMLRILEEKGHLKHRREGARYIYEPTLSPEEAGRSAMNYMVQAFFNGSAERAVAALLDLKSNEFSDDDLDRLAGLVEKAKQEGQ
ncbi:MAG: BlaI/MecI/CopY family transcriptional regulator [Rhodothermales bacterium]